MLRRRTEKEIDELIALARTFCEVRAWLADARLEGRISLTEEEETQAQLKKLDEKIELLKSNSELIRSRAYARNNIIRLHGTARKAAK